MYDLWFEPPVEALPEPCPLCKLDSIKRYDDSYFCPECEHEFELNNLYTEAYHDYYN